MIEITRAPLQVRDWQIKVVGVGSAGCHAVDRLSQEGLSEGDLLVANTDSRALTSCLTQTKIPLGQSLTRGLGAGGDPDVGCAAVEESLDAVGGYLAGASLVILLTGLGGGTGSGATPRIAQAAREQGAHVVVLATTPFSFEGKRRGEQAVAALSALRENSDLVICFENDRMSSLVDASAGIQEAFGAVDKLLSQAVRALVTMTKRQSIMHSGIDEIAAALSGSYSAALFGYGVADGDDRVNEALRKAFSSPLLGVEGEVSAASGLWVYISGGSDLRWAEVQMLMTEINRQVSKDVRLFFGAAVDPHLTGSVSVTFLAGVPCVSSVPIKKTPLRPRESVVSGFIPKPPPPLSIPSPRIVPEEVEDQSEGEEENLVAKVSDEVQEPSLPLPEPVVYQRPTLKEDEVEEPIVVPSVASVVELADDAQREEQPKKSILPPRPPFERASELRKDVGAAFLKRRLLARAGREGEVSEERNEPVPEHREVSSEPDLPLQSEVIENSAQNIEAPRQEEPRVEQSVTPGPSRSEPEIARTPVDESSSQPTQLQAQPHSKTKATVQEQMHFEPVNRGRFEKTDPTVVDGQDLDIPTFMRQRVSIGGDSAPANTTP